MPDWYGSLVFPDTPITPDAVRAGVRSLTGRPKPRPNPGMFAAVPQQGGSISVAHPRLTDRISDGIAGALRTIGLPRYSANMIGSRTSGFLNDFTPLGAAASAEDAKTAWRQGRYPAALGNALLAGISALPDFGAVTGKVSHAIIAPLFHGSAKKFERFADEFIGSGEGAQGYGYGHYLSESKRLANSYRNPKLDLNMGPNAGALYETRVNADVPDFINMDAPLVAQPQAIQELARSMDLSALPEGRRARVVMERFRAGMEQPEYLATGQHLHNAFTNYGADTEANKRLSKIVADQGFAGFRYGQPKDALGGGGRNFVVFDPSIIDIINRH